MASRRRAKIKITLQTTITKPYKPYKRVDAHSVGSRPDSGVRVARLASSRSGTYVCARQTGVPRVRATARRRIRRVLFQDGIDQHLDGCHQTVCKMHLAALVWKAVAFKVLLVLASSSLHSNAALLRQRRVAAAAWIAPDRRRRRALLLQSLLAPKSSGCLSSVHGPTHGSRTSTHPTIFERAHHHNPSNRMRRFTNFFFWPSW